MTFEVLQPRTSPSSQKEKVNKNQRNAVRYDRYVNDQGTIFDEKMRDKKVS